MRQRKCDLFFPFTAPLSPWSSAFLKTLIVLVEKYKWDKAKGVFTTGQYELLSEKQRLKTEGQQVQEQEPRHLYVCS